MHQAATPAAAPVPGPAAPATAPEQVLQQDDNDDDDDNDDPVFVDVKPPVVLVCNPRLIRQQQGRSRRSVYTVDLTDERPVTVTHAIAAALRGDGGCVDLTLDDDVSQ